MNIYTKINIQTLPLPSTVQINILCLKVLTKFDKMNKNSKSSSISKKEFMTDGKKSKRHIETIHKGRKPYSCGLCNYSCSEKASLTKHLKSVHEGKK